MSHEKEIPTSVIPEDVPHIVVKANDADEIPERQVDVSEYPPTDVITTEQNLEGSQVDMSKMPYMDRELSWLKFNSRVLDLVSAERVPLMEKIKFLSIVNSNMDEFFSIRVASRLRDIEFGHEEDFETRRIVNKIIKSCNTMGIVVDATYMALMEKLKEKGIVVHSLADDPEVFKAGKVKRHFKYGIKPSLAPLTLDETRPIPHLKPFSIYIVSIVKTDGGDKIGLIEIPPHLDRIVSIGKHGWYFVEDIIISHMDQLYPGVECTDITAFRVLRDGDTVEVSEDMDYVEAMMKHARSRILHNEPVRLDIWGTPNKKLVNIIRSSLDIPKRLIFQTETRLKMRDLMVLYNGVKDDSLKYPPFKPAKTITGGRPGSSISIMDMIRENDYIVHHPYESFNDSVLKLIKEASHDPHVVSIKQTLYRSGEDSKILKHLIHAAESGKSVVVVMEIKARFDEEVNIEWAEKLQRAGATVVYGYENIKTHAKLLHIFRKKGKNFEQYCHIGTGNYSEKNSKSYTDFSYFTSNKKTCSDINTIFNMLTGGFISHDVKFHNIYVSPKEIRPTLYQLIDDEISKGEMGYINIKVNKISDHGLTQKFYEASRAGVKIDITCREACSVVAKVPGYSDNISVKSIVGRFLEHSRVFVFGRGEQARVFITSSDLMTRNLDRRLEILFEVDDPKIKDHLLGYMNIVNSDRTNAYEMNETGEYDKLEGDYDSQQKLIELYAKMSRTIYQ